MKRRTLLRGAAALLGGAGLAGCTGAGGEVPVTAEPPPAGLPTERESGGGGAPGLTPGDGAGVSIVSRDWRSGPDGQLVVPVTVENASDRQQVRLVQAIVEIDDIRTVGDRFVRLAPRETRTVRVHVDVSFEAWNATGSLEVVLVRATPATPIPTDRETPTETVRGAGTSPTPTPESDTESETEADSATPADSPTESTTDTDSTTPTDSGTATE